MKGLLVVVVLVLLLACDIEARRDRRRRLNSSNKSKSANPLEDNFQRICQYDSDGRLVALKNNLQFTLVATKEFDNIIEECTNIDTIKGKRKTKGPLATEEAKEKLQDMCTEFKNADEDKLEGYLEDVQEACVAWLNEIFPPPAAEEV